MVTTLDLDNIDSIKLDDDLEGITYITRTSSKSIDIFIGQHKAIYFNNYLIYYTIKPGDEQMPSIHRGLTLPVCICVIYNTQLVVCGAIECMGFLTINHLISYANKTDCDKVRKLECYSETLYLNNSMSFRIPSTLKCLRLKKYCSITWEPRTTPLKIEIYMKNEKDEQLDKWLSALRFDYPLELIMDINYTVPKIPLSSLTLVTHKHLSVINLSANYPVTIKLTNLIVTRDLIKIQGRAKSLVINGVKGPIDISELQTTSVILKSINGILPNICISHYPTTLIAIGSSINWRQLT